MLAERQQPRKGSALTPLAGLPVVSAQMRGIISAGGHVPCHRLDRAEIAALFGKGGGRGTRAVASFDEDATTMGYAAARNALRSASRGPGSAGQTPSADETPPARTPTAGNVAGTANAPAEADSTEARAAGGRLDPEVWFATASPAYLDKTNACAIHAALGLDQAAGALDFGGALRSGMGALRTALAGSGTTLVVAADIRDGMPASAEEASAGDGAAAILVGDDHGDDHGGAGEDGDTDGRRVIAECLGSGVASDELLDRWRLPGSRSPSASPERFGEAAYAPLLQSAWTAALDNAGVEAADIDRLLVAGMNARALARNARIFGDAPADPLTAEFSQSAGNTGTAHPLLLLTAALETAEPGETIASVLAADGAEVLILRTTDAIASFDPAASLADQLLAAKPLGYGTFLAWRDLVTVEPPNRPPPSAPSAAASYRRRAWKFGFVGSRDRSSRMLHLPPARVSERGGAIDDMAPAPMAGIQGTVAALTVDRLAYSPSPPVVFAVVDFDDGGRMPLELTDVSADHVAVGDRVEPTFRRLFTADGAHNYFWKARPVPAESTALQAVKLDDAGAEARSGSAGPEAASEPASPGSPGIGQAGGDP